MRSACASASSSRRYSGAQLAVGERTHGSPKHLLLVAEPESSSPVDETGGLRFLRGIMDIARIGKLDPWPHFGRTLRSFAHSGLESIAVGARTRDAHDHFVHRIRVVWILMRQYYLKLIDSRHSSERFEQHARVDEHAFYLQKVFRAYDRRDNTIAGAPAMRTHIVRKADDVTHQISDQCGPAPIDMGDRKGTALAVR